MTCNYSRYSRITLGLLALFCTRLAAADDPPPEQASGWQRLFREQAADYRIAVADSGEASLIAKPVLQWAHPARGGQHGAVFLWIKDGVPVSIGTFNIWPLGDGRQRVAHELHSLSHLPMTATWKKRRWTPPKDAITFQPADSGEAVTTADGPQRPRRMRQIAEEFTACSRDGNDQRSQLRLLPRPLYRYEMDEKADETPRDVIDGELFGFVEGTDLEIVLALELRRTNKGDTWWYAAARMSDFRLELAREGKTVWQVGPANYDRANEAYYCSTVETRASPESP